MLALISMAHRGAAEQVLPAAARRYADRGFALIAGHRDWGRDVSIPNAADCYRYVLHHPAVSC